MTNTILTLLSQDRLQDSYASGYWRNDSIFSLVRQHSDTTPDRIAVRDRWNSLSYRELFERAESVAQEFADAGLKQGDRVTVWLSSRIETAIVFVACSRSGLVCCPSLHRDHTTGDVLELMNRIRAAAFVGEQGYGADAARHDIFTRLAEVPTLKVHYRLAKGDSVDGDPFPKRMLKVSTSATVEPNRVVYLAFTSGTTGRPKGVMHSDNTLLANARAMIEDWRFDATTVIYTMSPLSHNLGLGSLIMALAAGGELVVHDLPRGASTLDRIIQVNATFIVGVPTHAMDLLGEMKARNLQAPGAVKGFRISGASAPRDVISELLACGVSPQSGFGMTEAGSHHYTRIGDDTDVIVNTSGRACDSYEVRIFSQDDPNVEVSVGEIGQIGGRGASLMLGYFDDQEANDVSFNREGWFLTGDLGRLDENGYLTITGRKKDLIIRGGHNIYPANIENLAMQHPAVARAAALPVPDRRLGEKVCLAMMVRAGQTVTADEVLNHLDRSGLSRYDMPEYYVMLDDIPLTASGKILKREIVDKIGAGVLVPTAIKFTPRETVSR
jgi:acyl-CoA synthetase (AMP-forming)/AMP-acid ligase II